MSFLSLLQIERLTESPVVIRPVPLSGTAFPHLDPLSRFLQSTPLLFPHTTAGLACETPASRDKKHIASHKCVSKMSENCKD